MAKKVRVKKGKYRSKLEGRVAEILGSAWDYEPYGVSYTQPRTYLVDFASTVRKFKHLLVEVKGFFRSGDASKYKAIHESALQQKKRLLFVFSNPHAPVRKGSKTSYAQWCEKNGILWTDVDGLKAFLKRI